MISDTGKRQCFYIPPCGSTYVDGRGYIPALVTEGEPGYQLMSGATPDTEPWYWGPTLDAAERTAATVNAARGISPLEAHRIVESSMAVGTVDAPESERCGRRFS